MGAMVLPFLSVGSESDMLWLVSITQEPSITSSGVAT